MGDFVRRVRSGLARVFGFARRDAMASRFDEEARYHVELQIERNVAAGMSPDEARRAALVAFGGATGSARRRATKCGACRWRSYTATCASACGHCVAFRRSRLLRS